mmetsp:Transcript_45086/g.113553  ORF Transcript_45086/g.113553 Transcript_45086/m.113553 type:complete len:94 (-) Transcript_45086:34-315(-)
MTAIQEREHGSDQTGPRQEPNPDYKNWSVYDPTWSTPRQVVERTIGVIKRFRKLAQGRLYVDSGAQIVNDMLAISCYVANEIIDCRLTTGRLV